jgi:hypothetical protein
MFRKKFGQNFGQTIFAQNGGVHLLVRCNNAQEKRKTEIVAIFLQKIETLFFSRNNENLQKLNFPGKVFNLKVSLACRVTK